jgi:hypothetical protein
MAFARIGVWSFVAVCAIGFTVRVSAEEASSPDIRVAQANPVPASAVPSTASLPVNWNDLRAYGAQVSARL